MEQPLRFLTVEHQIGHYFKVTVRRFTVVKNTSISDIYFSKDCAKGK